MASAWERGIFLQGDAAGEVLAAGLGGVHALHVGGHHPIARTEVHDELPAGRFQRVPFVAERHPGPGGEGAGFEQRIFHARNLLEHGLQRFADDGRAHPLGAQVANFFHLQEVDKGIAVRDRDQSGFLPLDQLSRRDAQDANYVRSTVTVHWFRLRNSLLVAHYENGPQRTQGESFPQLLITQSASPGMFPFFRSQYVTSEIQQERAAGAQAYMSLGVIETPAN